MQVIYDQLKMTFLKFFFPVCSKSSPSATASRFSDKFMSVTFSPLIFTALP